MRLSGFDIRPRSRRAPSGRMDRCALKGRRPLHRPRAHHGASEDPGVPLGGRRTAIPADKGAPVRRGAPEPRRRGRLNREARSTRKRLFFFRGRLFFRERRSVGRGREGGAGGFPVCRYGRRGGGASRRERLTARHTRGGAHNRRQRQVIRPVRSRQIAFSQDHPTLRQQLRRRARGQIGRARRSATARGEAGLAPRGAEGPKRG
mmetsp:Transcript_2312/g.6025  ORF Transcript_2312/g.6025 Transcript_2312/m.6025 type:complete len:205 (-) Transcript_2312:91-705(-)